METKTSTICIIPVLPSADIARDISWYNKKVGFDTIFYDNMYAILKRDNLYIHLQWHAGTEDDPLPGGSVIRIFVKDIQPIFDEFIQRGSVNKNKFVANTSWEQMNSDSMI